MRHRGDPQDNSPQRARLPSRDPGERVLGAAREVVDDFIRGDLDCWANHYSYLADDSRTALAAEPPEVAGQPDRVVIELDSAVFDGDDLNGVWHGHHDIRHDVEVREVEVREVTVRRRKWWQP